jgi:hypothetical protein
VKRKSISAVFIEDITSLEQRNMNLEVISVHIPKAAGGSIRESFAAVYGKDAVYLDYADDPVNPCSDYNIDPDSCRRKAIETCSAPGTRLVHRHFDPSKYENLFRQGGYEEL